MNQYDEFREFYIKNSTLNLLTIEDLNFLNAIEFIRKQNKKLKAEFLSLDISPLKKSHSEADRDDYFIKIVPYARGLFLSGDEFVLAKFKTLRINNSLKWFLSIDELLDEINSLHSCKEFEFDKLDVLIIAVLYIEQQLFLSIESELGFVETNNNVPEINSSKVLLKNSLRRRKYNSEKNQNGKLTEIDTIYNELIFNPSALLLGEKESFDLISKLSNSEDSPLIAALNTIFKNTKLSKRAKNIILFPLIKLVFKKNKLFSREEYFLDKQISDCFDKFSDTTYDSYMASRVKKILTKK